MELSIREAQAQFAQAIEAARRGERVVITDEGRPVAELGPPQAAQAEDFWERGDRIRRELGLDKITLAEGWEKEFDDPAFSREVLGLDDEEDAPGIRR